MKFKNANLWFIRNIFTSYKWDKKKKNTSSSCSSSGTAEKNANKNDDVNRN